MPHPASCARTISYRGPVAGTASAQGASGAGVEMTTDFVRV